MKSSIKRRARRPAVPLSVPNPPAMEQAAAGFLAIAGPTFIPALPEAVRGQVRALLPVVPRQPSTLMYVGAAVGGILLLYLLSQQAEDQS